MPDTSKLPKEYANIEAGELQRRITDRKRELGERLVILGHHYQRDDVVQFADHIGDSLMLSRKAAEQKRAEFIIFCGVHFMAESADILSSPGQTICLPNLQAGCTMADMAEGEDVADAVDALAGLTEEKVVPVVYVNSAAAIKAIAGRAGGACCTSSNARAVFEWALRPAGENGAGGGKILALPDQHLARNTAVAMGYSEGDCVLYDPSRPAGGLTREQVDAATFLLWKGHCYVHQFFTVPDIERVRAEDPDVTVMVHPECPREVVAAADMAGSTEQIRRAVGAAEPGTSWAIGTESHMVERLARTHRDRRIRVLSQMPAVCAQMIKIDLPHLLWTLDAVAAGEPVNVIRVPDDIAADARTALERMITI